MLAVGTNGLRSAFIATLLILIPCAPSTATAAPRNSKDRAAEEAVELFIQRGDQAMQEENYREAVNQYRAAYLGLDPERRASRLGSMPIRKAMNAYDALWEQDHDPADLSEQLALLDDFLTTAKDTKTRSPVSTDVLDSLREQKSFLEQKIGSLTAEPQQTDPPLDTTNEAPETKDGASDIEHSDDPPVGAPESQPTEPFPQHVQTEVTDHQPVSRQGRRPLRTAGIVLLGTGGALTVAGIGVASVYWMAWSSAQRDADEFIAQHRTSIHLEKYLLDREEYLVAEDRSSRLYGITGAVLSGAGLSLVATGAVLLGRHRKATKQHARLQYSGAFARNTGVFVVRVLF